MLRPNDWHWQYAVVLYDRPEDALSEPERTYAELQVAASDLAWLLSRCDTTLCMEGVSLAQLRAEAASLEERRREVTVLLQEVPITRRN